MARAISQGVTLELNINEASALFDLLHSGVSRYTLEEMDLVDVMNELRGLVPSIHPAFREVAILEDGYYAR